MRTISSLIAFVFITGFVACKKDSGSTGDNSLASLNGSWKTTVWGGTNDTAIVNIKSSEATGALTYLSDGAISDSYFSIGDEIFANIKATDTNTFSMLGTYRYFPPNGTQSMVGHTTGTITLQSSNTIYVQYTKDESTGIQPPDYYWVK